MDKKTKVKLVREGDGKQIIKKGDKIAAVLRGRVVDGDVFYGTVQKPVMKEFVIGSLTLLPEWEEGFIGQSKGQCVALFIPPEKAFGDKKTIS